MNNMVKTIHSVMWLTITIACRNPSHGRFVVLLFEEQ